MQIVYKNNKSSICRWNRPHYNQLKEIEQISILIRYVADLRLIASVCGWSISQIIFFINIVLLVRCINVNEAKGVCKHRSKVAFCGFCLPPWEKKREFMTVCLYS